MRKNQWAIRAGIGLAAMATAAMLAGGCGGPKATAKLPAHRAVIQNMGSDTMVNVAQAWAEEYARVEPGISVEVSGGGTGTGVAALINGTADIANCSRKLEPEEAAKVRAATGQEPKLDIVGHDALAIFVHRDNPLEEITIEQLAAIYGEQGATRWWSDLGVRIRGCSSNEMVLLSRQSNSGTYHYFREAILGRKGDFKLGTLDLHGSKDVVELVSRTPCAIGYSGIGYKTSSVKALDLAAKEGAPFAKADPSDVYAGKYPLARFLMVYVNQAPGRPLDPLVREFLRMVLSKEGQEVVVKDGYLPLTPKMIDSPDATWVQLISYRWRYFVEEIEKGEYWIAAKLAGAVVSQVIVAFWPSFGDYDVVDRLAGGRWVPGTLVAQAVLVLGVLWSTLVGLLGWGIMENTDVARVTV